MIDCSTSEITAGVHTMQCVEAKKQTSREKGHLMMVLTWADEEGVTLKDYFIYERGDGQKPRQAKFRGLFRAMERENPIFDPADANNEGHFEEFEGLVLPVNVVVKTPVDPITGATGYPTPEISGYMKVS